MTYPVSAHDLLSAPGTAILSTHNPSGQIQSTAIWYLLDGDVLKISVSDARKKLRNVREDPTVTFFMLDPANPFHFIEVRGTASLSADPDFAFRNRVGAHYSTDLSSFDQPGDERFVLSIEPITINVQ